MRLDQYLEKNAMKLAEFGEVIGCSGVHVHRLRSGKKLPSLKLALKIERATEGLVTPADFFEDAPQPESRSAAA